MKTDWKKLVFYLVLPLTVGTAATLLSGGMRSYSQLRQPPLSPPSWVFIVVWTVLYILMGYSAYRVSAAPEDGWRRKGLLLYFSQLAVNFLWPLVFFGLHRFTPAFGVLLILWVLIIATMRAFYEVDTLAGALLLPYLLWVTFAGYLNAGIAVLN